MGDWADAILDGDFDEETGEYIGPGDGYPRSLAREARERGQRNWGKRDIKSAKNGLHKYLGSKYEDYKNGDLERIMDDFLKTLNISKDTFAQKVVTTSENFTKFCQYLNKIKPIK